MSQEGKERRRINRKIRKRKARDEEKLEQERELERSRLDARVTKYFKEYRQDIQAA